MTAVIINVMFILFILDIHKLSGAPTTEEEEDGPNDKISSVSVISNVVGKIEGAFSNVFSLFTFTKPDTSTHVQEDLIDEIPDCDITPYDDTNVTPPPNEDKKMNDDLIKERFKDGLDVKNDLEVSKDTDVNNKNSYKNSNGKISVKDKDVLQIEKPVVELGKTETNVDTGNNIISNAKTDTDVIANKPKTNVDKPNVYGDNIAVLDEDWNRDILLNKEGDIYSNFGKDAIKFNIPDIKSKDVKLIEDDVDVVDVEVNNTTSIDFDLEDSISDDILDSEDVPEITLSDSNEDAGSFVIKSLSRSHEAVDTDVTWSSSSTDLSDSDELTVQEKMTFFRYLSLKRKVKVIKNEKFKERLKARLESLRVSIKEIQELREIRLRERALKRRTEDL